MQGNKEIGPVQGGRFSAQVMADDVVFVVFSGCA
jgi:hypothetical protein